MQAKKLRTIKALHIIVPCLVEETIADFCYPVEVHQSDLVHVDKVSIQECLLINLIHQFDHIIDQFVHVIKIVDHVASL